LSSGPYSLGSSAWPGLAKMVEECAESVRETFDMTPLEHLHAAAVHQVRGHTESALLHQIKASGALRGVDPGHLDQLEARLLAPETT
jgi:hypothetical protein